MADFSPEERGGLSLSSRPRERSDRVEGSCTERESCSEHGSILAFPLGGRCHEVTEEGSGETRRQTPLISRLRRQLPPQGEAEANGRANCLS